MEPEEVEEFGVGEWVWGLGLGVAGLLLIGQTQASPTISAIPGMSSTPTPQSYQQPPMQIEGSPDAVQRFRELVFSSEMNGYHGIVTKWNKPILVEFHGSYTQQDLDAFYQFAGQLQGITGVSIQAVQSGGNVQMIFGQSHEIAQYVPAQWQGKTGDMWGFMHYYPSHSSIESGQILIDTGKPKREWTIAHEMGNLMGLGNDGCSDPDSLLCDSRYNPVLSPLDIEVLKLLYSDAIQHGMTEQEALSILGGY